MSAGPIVPPFDDSAARAIVQAFEDAWNRRVAEEIPDTCTADTCWRYSCLPGVVNPCCSQTRSAIAYKPLTPGGTVILQWQHLNQQLAEHACSGEPHMIASPLTLSRMAGHGALHGRDGRPPKR